AARLKAPGKAPSCDHGLPAWSGASLRCKTLLVTAEQGGGDQIMFASLLPGLAARAAAEGGRVLMDCEPRLQPLFARSFPDIAVFPQHLETKAGAVNARYGWLKAAGGANLAIEMGSLPRLLRRELQAFPSPHVYLRPDEADRSHWRGHFEA